MDAAREMYSTTVDAGEQLGGVVPFKIKLPGGLMRRNSRRPTNRLLDSVATYFEARVAR